MKLTSPKVILVGETKVIPEGLAEVLAHYDAAGWSPYGCTDDASLLITAMGKLCYGSFEVGYNPNISRVRNDTEQYLGNILSSGHGSVLEHAVLNFVILGISRVATHELVRHRAGTAFSQESLRFVRLDNIKAWMPQVIEENDEAANLFTDTVAHLEEVQRKMADILDVGGLDFHGKKGASSAMRRLAPIGLATVIGFSANIRALRWFIEARSARYAEEEIRIVANQVAEICMEKYPLLFQDFTKELVEGHYEYIPESRKV